MTLTYNQKQQVFRYLARPELWRHEPATDRLLENFYERMALSRGEAPPPRAADSQPFVWSHILTEKIAFPRAAFPWLYKGAGADSLRLIMAFDLGLDRALGAQSVARELNRENPSLFVPWSLTTEFNGTNIDLSRHFAIEMIKDQAGKPCLQLATNVTNKYAALAKTQLFMQAGACPREEKRGALLHQALKALESAPVLPVAGQERNEWRAFVLHAEAPPGGAVADTRALFQSALGLGAESYAVLDYGDGDILCGIEETEYRRIAAAASTSLYALHAIHTGKCADWAALGRDMAAYGADLKYVDPQAALGDINDLGSLDEEPSCFADLMQAYGRDALLAAYDAARNGRDGPGPAAPTPAP